MSPTNPGGHAPGRPGPPELHRDINGLGEALTHGVTLGEPRIALAHASVPRVQFALTWRTRARIATSPTGPPRFGHCPFARATNPSSAAPDTALVRRPQRLPERARFAPQEPGRATVPQSTHVETANQQDRPLRDLQDAQLRLCRRTEGVTHESSRLAIATGPRKL